MKLKLLSLFIFIFLANAPALRAQEQDLSGIDYSDLEIVLDSVYEASFELDSYFKVTIEQGNQEPGSNCVPVRALDLKNKIWYEVKRFKSHYPDDELPFNKAYKQMNKLIGNSPYQKCETIISKNSYEIIVQLYVSSGSNYSFQLEFERHN